MSLGAIGAMPAEFHDVESEMMSATTYREFTVTPCTPQIGAEISDMINQFSSHTVPTI